MPRTAPLLSLRQASLYLLIALVGAVTLPATARADTTVMRWHTLTLDFEGPELSESATPNPFTDYRLDVTFSQGDRTFVVPGYYAADGDAANSSADSGTVWRVHFSPDQEGDWTWSASFRRGKGVAVSKNVRPGAPAGFFDGKSGTFTVTPSDKQRPDLRAMGRLVNDGTRYPKTLGDGEIFLKAGADSPENFLAYAEFDGSFKTDGHRDHHVKTWAPHVRDWNPGDPTWADGKGKGIIGAINYLSSKGLNAVSMLTMNIGGDDRNVFPYTDYDERQRFDISRLEQWRIVVEHANHKGLFVHFKTQETENETLLDNGDVGPQRRLYYRELVARFGHLLAMNWNLGEENGKWGKNHHKPRFQTTEQRVAMAQWFHDHDPYGHPIVAHNGQWPGDLYGPDNHFDGWSLQTSTPTFRNVHRSTLNILNAAKNSGKVWMVACDEPGDASHAVKPDDLDPDHFHARTNALWGVFLAGGWGIEWYYGYKNPHSDLTLQDHRSRANMYAQSAHALHFFRSNAVPVGEMDNHNKLLVDADGFCLADPGQVYVVLVKDASKPAKLDLGSHAGPFTVRWYNPRTGGDLQTGQHTTLSGGGQQLLGAPPAEPDRDWVALIRKSE
ncbi:MAG: DUF5060 domain-containing protein [Planctomycetota bacterium]